MCCLEIEFNGPEVFERVVIGQSIHVLQKDDVGMLAKAHYRNFA